MFAAGERVKYVGKTGIGYPFAGEVGKVLSVAGDMVKVEFRDGQMANLPEDQFKKAPIIIPIIGYSVTALAAVILTWKVFR